MKKTKLLTSLAVSSFIAVSVLLVNGQNVKAATYKDISTGSLINVNSKKDFTIIFNRDVNRNTINGSIKIVNLKDNSNIPFAVNNSSDNKINISLGSNYKNGEEYSIIIDQTIEDKYGIKLDKPYKYSFKTKSSSSSGSSSSSNSNTSKQQSITNATASVEKAENSKIQSDVNSAKTLVNALADNSDKTSLLNRLQAVQNIIDANTTAQQKLSEATTAVENAESSKTQADVDSAKTKVNALADSSDKTSLLNRLQAVQNIIDANTTAQQKLSEATTAVENAESSKTQADVDSAKTKVNALADSSDKTSLLNRLQAVQNIIDANTTAQQKLSEATTAVENAESSKTQADVDSAKTKVNALADSSDKTSLLNRLQAVQNIIDANTTAQQKLSEATTAVENAESSKTQADVDSAKTKVNALADSSDKTSLLNRLQAVQNIIDANTTAQQKLSEATTAVENAESSKTQADVDSAKTKVNALADSSDKTSLLNRLQAVQNIIDANTTAQQKLSEATTAVENAESSKTQADVDSAKTKVNALADSSDKTSLLNRLQAVQNEIDANTTAQQKLSEATTAVENAESSKTQADVDSAKTKVNALADSSDKTSLLNRLQAVQNIIDVANGDIKTPEEFSTAIKNSLKNFDSSLTINIENYSSEQYNLSSIMSEIFKENPDLNFGYKSSHFSGTTSNGIVTATITFSYYDTQSNLINKSNQISSKVTEIVNSVTNATMSDYDKELALHDYLVNNCQYDQRVIDGTIPDNSDNTYNAYGALINGSAVCQGYADAMYRLLKGVGIESMSVSGTATNGVETENHAWNIVKIGGQYYQLDATFDDPSYKDGSNHPTHDYFNVTDDLLAQDHTWDRDSYPVCNSSEYSYK
ncbi:transglutaminase domain-containing protein [Clostridium tyrobutyricum]|uniref:transglutaminase domain-containing protein n=1 Tax=Clostridium tyrobutyricum TaxID=1519 RepID=UPI0011C7FE70|nr:transglutaminase domain-containing protein [Clostridium tyrobutyricum]